MRIVSEQEIRAVVREPEALHAAELAFRALGEGRAVVPPPLGLQVDSRGELHVKCAYLQGERFFVAKAATGFYDNARRGLPSGSGLMLLFDAETGVPVALLEDNGYLTEMRTAAAAVLAAKLLAKPGFETLAIIGAGAQARYQLRAFNSAFSWRETRIWARDRARAERLRAELQEDSESSLRTAETVEAAVRAADVVVTVTSSTSPLVRGAWLSAHATVIAVGSDNPQKRELDGDVFVRAGKIVVDSVAQCAELGELHHAIDAGIVTRDSVYAELGQVVVGERVGRTGEELIVCDLTGVGAQDAAIALRTTFRIPVF